jgi:hypothetical protein
MFCISSELKDISDRGIIVITKGERLIVMFDRDFGQ